MPINVSSLFVISAFTSYLSVFLPRCLCVCLCASLCASVCLCVCVSIYLSVYLPVHWRVYAVSYAVIYVLFHPMWHLLCTRLCRCVNEHVAECRQRMDESVCKHCRWKFLSLCCCCCWYFGRVDPGHATPTAFAQNQCDRGQGRLRSSHQRQWSTVSRVQSVGWLRDRDLAHWVVARAAVLGSKIVEMRMTTSLIIHGARAFGRVLVS